MNTDKIGIIIQARIGSTRLPGKVLMKVDENNTLLDMLIKRLKLCKKIDKIIVATTYDKKNLEIVENAKLNKVAFYIGSEDNVLERFYFAAKENSLNVIIRICSDNPFIDPVILDELILFYLKNSYDYVRINNETSKFPLGFLSEIFSFKVLEQVYNLATKKAEKEHVTYYIYTHPDKFSIHDYKNNEVEKLNNHKQLRLTIDEKPDLEFCKILLEKLKEKGKKLNFSLFDIIEIIEEEPELMNINKHVSQKTF